MGGIRPTCALKQTLLSHKYSKCQRVSAKVQMWKRARKYVKYTGLQVLIITLNEGICALTRGSRSTRAFGGILKKNKATALVFRLSGKSLQQGFLV